MTPTHRLIGIALLAGTCTAQAQPAPPAPAASAPPAPAAQRVEVIGGRESEEDQRRQSTAAKIVIGREEILRFGDGSLAEVMKRLPGVTTSGPPGRGGAPALRGLGGGYTQILIDGQRAPAGFTLDQLTPEQLERIELLRAPTAETGARAIGGTINLVTREGFKAKLNDVRLGIGMENGKATPGGHWTYNRGDGEFSLNVTGGLFAPHGRPQNRFTTINEDVATGQVTHRETVEIDTNFGRIGANLNARLQWRDKDGSSLLLAPGFFGSTGDGKSRFRFTESFGAPQPTYDHGVTGNESSFGSLRLNVDARRRVGPDWRLEGIGSIALTRWSGHSLRRELDRTGALTRTEQVDSRGRERILNTTAKASRLLGADSGHSLVLGSEFEHLRRDEQRVTLNNGVHQFGEDDDDLAATVQRIALYAQDEWTITPSWSAHAGLRSEVITTRGDDLGGASPVNRSRVTTPLLHLLYKPDPKKRDQIRLSLTRSYKSPTLANLIGRPAVSSRFPLPGTNTPTFADRAGNPDLKPELATGLDLAFERYLEGGGVLSANLFTRRLSDYIRNLTRLETVGYAPVPRYVSRPANLGRARTHGVEVEAKFRLDQAIADAPPVDLRANLSAYRSRVDQVPGPDNRLDNQPKAALNLGADHRFRGIPLTIGGSLNLVPAYRTQASDVLAGTTPRKRQFDAHALWVFGPTMQLRLNLTNLLPEDFATATIVETAALREQQVNTQRTDLSARVTLELKL